jgi:hypothetical protein
MRRRSSYQPVRMSTGMAVYLLTCVALVSGCLAFAFVRLVLL